MTAFGRAEQMGEWGQVCWELRSVNHRFLEMSIHLPEEFRYLDTIVRERVQQKVKRGKIDCSFHFQANPENYALTLNTELLQQLLQAIRTVYHFTHQQPHFNAIEILQWPGILQSPTVNVENVQKNVLSCFDQTLEQLILEKQREGRQLANLLEQRRALIAQVTVVIRQELPTVLNLQQERLRCYLAEIRGQLDRERLEQEIVLLANKMDVAEEMDRLDTHLAEIEIILNREELVIVGRRLDFLIQELQREANTLGAKANHITITRQVVELKVLIEQMREQTQNIE